MTQTNSHAASGVLKKAGMVHISKKEYQELLKKKPKYHNKKTEFNGKVYHSKKEAEYASECFLEVRGLSLESYAEQVRFQLIVNRVKVGVYVADFVKYHRDGRVEIVDVKGMETQLFKLKWKLMKALYPEYEYAIV